MVRVRRLPILLAAVTLAWAPVAFSASPSTDAEHEQHHPKTPAKKPAPTAAPAQTSTRAPTAQSATGSTDLDSQVAHLRAIRERMSRANTPEERQALMAERNKVMQDAMTIMHKDMERMCGAGGMSSSKAGGTAPAQMQMCHDMMGPHMAFMQEMMQSMMDSQGMMGGGMGSAGMMGK